jgi:hypothetical protein
MMLNYATQHDIVPSAKFLSDSVKKINAQNANDAAVML